MHSESTAVEARIGAINEINNNVLNTTETARNVASRIHELRSRLVTAHDNGACDTNQPSPPEPVRSEVEELGHSVDVLNRVLTECIDDLSALERL